MACTPSVSPSPLWPTIRTLGRASIEVGITGYGSADTEVEHRSVQQTVLVAIEEYLSRRETAEILADPSALRGLAEARESEQSDDVIYGAEAARALLTERKR